MTIRSQSALSEPRRKLVQVIRRLHYGQILQLQILKGEPVFDPAPQVVRDIKLASDPSPRPEPRAATTELTQQFWDLFAFFDQLRDGVIDRIEIKAGQPFRVLLTETLV